MKESVRYVFSDAEIEALGKRLAHETQNVYDLQTEKANVASQLASDLKAANKRVADLSFRINSGYEMRDVEVIELLDAPGKGLKTVIRVDTQESIRVEPMTDEDSQTHIEFEVRPG